MYGGVGRGKTLLMDMFYEAAAVTSKRRVHFHAFMLDVQDRFHALRKAGKSGDEPIRPVADSLAAEGWLLCFDEFHVTNVADAMILGRLFENLLDRGIVIVATSNRAPDELYLGGLQRQRFLPTIALLKERLDILHLAAERDYRLDRLLAMDVYHTPLGVGATQALDAAFIDLTGGAKGAPEEIPVKGRTLLVPRAAHGVAMFSFAELCERPLGAADYLEIAEEYNTVILDGIPCMAEAQRNLDDKSIPRASPASRRCRIVSGLPAARGHAPHLLSGGRGCRSRSGSARERPLWAAVNVGFALLLQLAALGLCYWVLAVGRWRWLLVTAREV